MSGERVVGYREKPKLPVSISSGTYVVNRRAMDRVPAGGRLDVPVLIDELLGADEPVLAFPHGEPWIDVNDEAALADAQRLLATHGARWPGTIAPDDARVTP